MQLGDFGDRYMHRRNAGFTMIEAIVSVGIFGIIVYTGLGVWKNISGLKIKLNLESDRVDIGLALRERIDCAKTLAAFTPSTACDAATVSDPVAVSLRDATDQILMESGDYSPTSVTDSYKAKASCYKDGPYYVMNADILASPQTTSEIKVFKNIGFLCWAAPMTPATVYPNSNVCCRSKSNGQCIQCGGSPNWVWGLNSSDLSSACASAGYSAPLPPGVDCPLRCTADEGDPTPLCGFSTQCFRSCNYPAPVPATIIYFNLPEDPLCPVEKYGEGLIMRTVAVCNAYIEE